MDAPRCKIDSSKLLEHSEIFVNVYSPLRTESLPSLFPDLGDEGLDYDYDEDPRMNVEGLTVYSDISCEPDCANTNSNIKSENVSYSSVTLPKRFDFEVGTSPVFKNFTAGTDVLSDSSYPTKTDVIEKKKCINDKDRCIICGIVDFANLKRDQMIKCEKCQGKVHYKCSELPVYELYQKTKDKRKKYVCDMCSDIPEDRLLELQEACKDPNNSVNDGVVADFTHSIQRFELSMADKISDIDNSVSAINTKVTDIDSCLDKRMNSFGTVIQKMSDKLDKLMSNMSSLMKIYDVSLSRPSSCKQVKSIAVGTDTLSSIPKDNMANNTSVAGKYSVSSLVDSTASASLPSSSTVTNMISTSNHFASLSSDNSDKDTPLEVTLLGDSQLKHLKCERLFGFKNKDKIKYVKTPLIKDISLGGLPAPNCLVVFTGTNNISNGCDPVEMANEYSEKLLELHDEAPNARIISILLVPRGDMKLSLNTSMFNSKVQIIFQEASWIELISVYDKLLYNGELVSRLYEKDKKHLNPNGLAIILSILKPKIRNVCKVFGELHGTPTDVSTDLRGGGPYSGAAGIGRGRGRGRRLPQSWNNETRLPGRRYNSEPDLVELLRNALKKY